MSTVKKNNANRKGLSKNRTTLYPWQRQALRRVREHPVCVLISRDPQGGPTLVRPEKGSDK